MTKQKNADQIADLTADDIIQKLEERGVGWSIKSALGGLDARVWEFETRNRAFPRLEGRYRPDEVEPLSAMLEQACRGAGLWDEINKQGHHNPNNLPPERTGEDDSPAKTSVILAALEAARHELTTLQGLVVADGACPEETWTIDSSKALTEIDAALGSKACLWRSMSKSKPHNYDDLTPDIVGVNEGYRLLNRDEIKKGPTIRSIERYYQGGWLEDCAGSQIVYSYRTKLTREQLAEKRKQA